MRLDIRKYFDSIPHDELLARLERCFKDRPLLALFARIVRSFRGALGQGVPIGSLTSQHFANFYLGWSDRYVKEILRMAGYVRYMDDMVLWAETTAEIKDALAACTAFLRGELRLELKASPYWNRTGHGMDFLGCRVFDHRLTLNARSRRRFGRQLADLERQHEAGVIDERQLQRRATALVAFTRTPGLSSRRFRAALLNRMRVSGHQAPTG